MSADHPSSPVARPSLREVLAIVARFGSVAGVGLAYAWPWIPRADGRAVLFAKRGPERFGKPIPEPEVPAHG